MKYTFIRILSSKTKDDWKKGDRIIVAIDDDYFLGTVTSIKSGQIYLLFDDGDNGKVSIGSKRILGRGIDKKVKKALSKREAEKYLVKSTQLVRPRNRIENKPQVTNNSDSDQEKTIIDTEYKIDLPSVQWGEWYIVPVKNKNGSIENVPSVVALIKKDVIVFIKDNREPLIIKAPFTIKVKKLPDNLLQQYKNRISRKQIYDKYKVFDQFYKSGKDLEDAQEAVSKADLPRNSVKVIHQYPDGHKWVILESKDAVEKDYKTLMNQFHYDPTLTCISLRDRSDKCLIFITTKNKIVDDIRVDKSKRKSGIRYLKDFADNNYANLNLIDSNDKTSGSYKFSDYGIYPSIPMQEYEEYLSKLRQSDNEEDKIPVDEGKWYFITTKNNKQKTPYYVIFRHSDKLKLATLDSDNELELADIKKDEIKSINPIPHPEKYQQHLPKNALDILRKNSIKIFRENKLDNKDIKIIHTYSDGYKWVMPETEEALERIRRKIDPNATLLFGLDLYYIALRDAKEKNIAVLGIDEKSSEIEVAVGDLNKAKPYIDDLVKNQYIPLNEDISSVSRLYRSNR